MLLKKETMINPGNIRNERTTLDQWLGAAS
jgi:hypothetical protein